MAAQTVRIVKMNGTGNDFALLDERPQRLGRYADLAKIVCDRNGPVGADGLLVVMAPRDGEAVASVRIFNADGSEPEQCGNGVRCVARYLWDRKEAGTTFVLETASGPLGVSVTAGDRFRARVEMPEAQILQRYAAGASIEAAGATWQFAEVSVGNPHVVAFVEDPAAVDLERVGEAIAYDRRFPSGTNVHVARAARPASDSGTATAVRARHFERGVGPTQACGTGAVAVAVAAIDDGRAVSPVVVQVPGGELEVEWQPGQRPFLTGGAEFEFERNLEL